MCLCLCLCVCVCVSRRASFSAHGWTAKCVKKNESEKDEDEGGSSSTLCVWCDMSKQTKMFRCVSYV